MVNKLALTNARENGRICSFARLFCENYHNKISKVGTTLVPEVFLRLLIKPRESGEDESRSDENRKLDLNLTFMQTPAVKRVKLISI